MKVGDMVVHAMNKSFGGGIIQEIYHAYVIVLWSDGHRWIGKLSELRPLEIKNGN